MTTENSKVTDQSKAFISYFDFWKNINSKRGGKISPLGVNAFWNEYQMLTLLSMRNDTIFYADEIAKLNDLPEDLKKEMQYAFLFHGLKESHYRQLPDGVNFRKEEINQEDEDLIDALVFLDGVSRKEARKALEWIPQAHRENILQITNKGGV